MAINRYYDVAPEIAEPLATGTGAGELAIDRERRLASISQWNRELAERRALANDELQYRYDSDAQRTGIDYASMLQRGQLAAADIQSRQAIVGAELQNRLDSEAMQNQTYLQGQANQSAAQLAKSMQDKRMELAISEHDGLMKAWAEGKTFTTDQQYQDAIRTWEEKHDMEWGLPQQLAEQQAMQQQAMQGDALYAAFTNPITGQPYYDRNAFEAVVGPLTPKERADHLKAKEAEARMQAKTQFDVGAGADDERRKENEFIANQLRDDERAVQQNKLTHERAMQQMYNTQLSNYQTQITTRNNAIANFNVKLAQDRAKDALLRATNKSSETPIELPDPPDFEGMKRQFLADLGPPPERPAPFAAPTAGAQPQVKPGEKVITSPDGRRAILHADGSVTPI